MRTYTWTIIVKIMIRAYKDEDLTQVNSKILCNITFLLWTRFTVTLWWTCQFKTKTQYQWAPERHNDTNLRCWEIILSERQREIFTPSTTFVNKCWDSQRNSCQSIHLCTANPRLPCEGLFPAETTWRDRKHAEPVFNNRTKRNIT